jgi:hypothetical protein
LHALQQASAEQEARFNHERERFEAERRKMEEIFAAEKARHDEELRKEREARRSAERVRDQGYEQDEKMPDAPDATDGHIHIVDHRQPPELNVLQHLAQEKAALADRLVPAGLREEEQRLRAEQDMCAQFRQQEEEAKRNREASEKRMIEMQIHLSRLRVDNPEAMKHREDAAAYLRAYNDQVRGQQDRERDSALDQNKRSRNSE